MLPDTESNVIINGQFFSYNSIDFIHSDCTDSSSFADDMCNVHTSVQHSHKVLTENQTIET